MSTLLHSTRHPVEKYAIEHAHVIETGKERC